MTILDEIKKERKNFIIEEERKRGELSAAVEEIVSTMESNEYVDKIFKCFISNIYLKDGIIKKGSCEMHINNVSLLDIRSIVEKAFEIKVDGYDPLKEIVYFNIKTEKYTNSISVDVKVTAEYIKRFIIPKFQGTGFEATVSNECIVVRLPEASLLTVYSEGKI